MALKGKDHIKTKLAINNKPTEQVHTFSYLGYDVSFDSCLYIKNKTHRFHMCGIT